MLFHSKDRFSYRPEASLLTQGFYLLDFYLLLHEVIKIKYTTDFIYSIVVALMLRFIPFTAQAGFTGLEVSTFEFSDLDLDLGQLLIDHPAATYIGIAEGESMVDAGIFSGDLLIISRAEEVRNEDVIVACLNGVFVVKKVDKKNNRLLPAAKGFMPYILQAGDEFKIEGVVTKSIRLHRALNFNL